MSLLHQPIVVGTASTNTAHKGDLGKFVFANGKVYIVVQAAATIATAANLGVEIGLTAGVPNWTVNIPASEIGHCFGIVPHDQVGSTGTTSIISGDYFLLQIAGPFIGISNTTLIDTTMLSGLLISSKGYVRAIGSASVAGVSVLVMPRNTGFLTNSAVVAVSEETTGYLAGLLI